MIDQHTLETLEFPKILAAIAGKCVTAYGSPEVARIGPLFDKSIIERRQAEVAQMKDIIMFGSAFPLYRLEDCREYLAQSETEGAFLDPKDMLKVLELAEVSISLHDYAKDEREKFPAVADYLPRIRAFPELKKEIRRAIDENGEVKDNASHALKRIRIDLFDTRRKIIGRLEGILAGRRKQAGWQDDVVTQRNGRYVIPVLAGDYSNTMGILHDRSQSGATFFVEPKETVDANNRLNQLAQDERLEIDRILRALTAEIAQRAEALMENCRLIGILDSIHAAARFAVQIDASSPSISADPDFALVDARHPLLLLQAENKESVIPLTLDLGESRQAVLVTGPNTGGKTIALKSIGLLVLMAQSGLPISADEKSKVGIFQQIHADIGDEQSIELSLSTFSSHVRNIIAATKDVSGDTLVIFDEIGAGTDPKEGAALAESIILYMIDKGARLVASTHYSHLKTLALDHPEIENASLEFDRESLSPTYRLQLGIPGASYAVEIASRLGMAKDICERASELLGPAERSLSDLIASLEQELSVIREDRVKLTERLAAAKKLEDRYQVLMKELDSEIETRKTAALEETDQLLKRSRKETERLVSEIRQKQATRESIRAMHSTLEKSRAELSRQKRKLRKEKKRQKPPDKFERGDPVHLLTLNQDGEIEELIGTEKARVRVGNFTMVVQLRNMEKLTKRPLKSRARRAGGSVEDASVSTEIHLRGMTVDEAREALDKFLDNAIVGGLGQVYVIHGKGTGTLRRTLSEYLRKHPEVAEFQLGNWNEGGSGVTVVKLKE